MVANSVITKKISIRGFKLVVPTIVLLEKLRFLGFIHKVNNKPISNAKV